jgi:pimeloyl-ACP methyl ester carboxylesterase
MLALAGTALVAPVTVMPSAPAGAQTAASSLHVTWMAGYDTPTTPARYNRVGVLKVGPAGAKNVLVLEPGTSAGSAYFVPLAQWIVAKTPGWQVWAVERRENLLEDQSEMNLAKEGKSSSRQLFEYYLGYLKDPKVTHHYHVVLTSSVEFAKKWGMDVAVGDLRIVIDAAHRLGGKVVLGGHSLGGAVVTAYATWDFSGKAGADGLAGLVYDDGGSFPAVSATTATKELATLDTPSTSPWLSFGGIPAPYAGIFSATGSLSALLWPNTPSLGQASGLLPADITPPVRVTNLGQYGYALNAATSPAALLAAQGHLGKGLSTRGPVHGWTSRGAITPISRFARMFSGYPVLDVTGTEWYFPQRLTDDSGAVDNGNANSAQQILDVDATMGHTLPTSLRIYAFATVLGGQGVLDDATTLAQQSGIPATQVTLVNRDTTYSHNDPAGAYPNNAFFSHLVPFLKGIG